jgi:hypothetical protein
MAGTRRPEAVLAERPAPAPSGSGTRTRAPSGGVEILCHQIMALLIFVALFLDTISARQLWPPVRYLGRAAGKARQFIF